MERIKDQATQDQRLMMRKTCSLFHLLTNFSDDA